VVPFHRAVPTLRSQIHLVHLEVDGLVAESTLVLAARAHHATSQVLQFPTALAVVAVHGMPVVAEAELLVAAPEEDQELQVAQVLRTLALAEAEAAMDAPMVA
jgi:hypothetical protein